jgi:hypothetical protein
LPLCGAEDFDDEQFWKYLKKNYFSENPQKRLEEQG